MRREYDSLGAGDVPVDALYGLATLRGQANFDVSRHRLGDEPALLRALAQIKEAAAATHRDLGVLPADIATALIAACREIAEGGHRDQFLIDMLEGSGGTSINMNMNEVIANRALQILGDVPGHCARVHPNDHVNMGQSTNDVVPSAVKLAVVADAQRLLDALTALASALDDRAAAFGDVLRLGRTCLQDAQPMRLGQAFGGHAAGLRRMARHLAQRCEELTVLPLGGTAIGTGLGSVPGYRRAVFAHLARISGRQVTPAEDLFDAMRHSDAFARCSAELRLCADMLAQMAGDLALLSSGPAGGIGEIRLPAVQPGSSIMPGKVNPVLPILMQQIAFAVAGNDLAVSLAAAHGQLEINHFEPLIASRLFDSLGILTRAVRLFTGRCVAGLEADHARSLANLLDSSALATVLVPALGYAQTARLVQTATAEGRRLADLAAEQGLIDADTILTLLHNSTLHPSADPATPLADAPAGRTTPHTRPNEP